MTQEYFGYMNSALTALFASQAAGFFVGTALLLFNVSVILRLMIFGADAMILSHFDKQAFWRFFLQALTISVVLNGWSTPISFIGLSAPGIVVNEAASLTSRLDNGQGVKLQTSLNDAYARMERPKWTTPLMDTVFYLFVVILISAMEVLSLAVTSIGIVVAAVCMLIGPLFVVAWMWPGTKHMFIGWLNAFIQYSFYAPVAAGIMYIATFVLIAFWNSHRGPVALDDLPIVGVQFIDIVGALILSLTFVPAITSSIFGGHSGRGIVRESSVAVM